jgi:hypothetical protein
MSSGYLYIMTFSTRALRNVRSPPRTIKRLPIRFSCKSLDPVASCKAATSATSPRLSAFCPCALPPSSSSSWELKSARSLPFLPNLLSPLPFSERMAMAPGTESEANVVCRRMINVSAMTF